MPVPLALYVTVVPAPAADLIPWRIVVPGVVAPLLPCQEMVQPLDDALAGLPHMGRALVHTMLEGFAADDFHLLSLAYADDTIGQLYSYIRRDEVQHVAIGLSYLARQSATRAGRDLWTAHAAQWHAAGLEFTYLDAVARSHAAQLGRDPAAVRQWFWRRHRARLSAAGIAPAAVGIETEKGGDSADEDRRGQDQGISAGRVQVHPPDRHQDALIAVRRSGMAG